jgi:hypothetical protein
MEKRIALIKDGIVFNIIVAPSEEEASAWFNCEAKEVTEETQPAHVGYGFSNGVFEQPIPEPSTKQFAVQNGMLVEVSDILE